ncbi:MAG: hypothetical protein GF372_14220 [Candidatus Marinimicrobia bacterium]|nr:hypothetical protein [Candidatus Neomarinimicrobiota bacterium]
MLYKKLEYNGKGAKIYFLVHDSGRCEVAEYLDDIQPKHKKKAIKYLQSLGDRFPHIRNPNLFKKLKGKGIDIVESRPAPYRILGFLDGHRQIVFAFCFKKQKGPTPRRHIEKAQRLYRIMVQNEEGNHG